MYSQMRSEIESSEGQEDRNPLSDPNLAYYLTKRHTRRSSRDSNGPSNEIGQRRDPAPVKERCAQEKREQGERHHHQRQEHGSAERDQSLRHSDRHEPRLRQRAAACTEHPERRERHTSGSADGGGEWPAAGGSSPV